MTSAIGVPVVLPSKTPDSTCTSSFSRLCDVWRLLPVALRANSCFISATSISSPGGQPSITQPIAGPWLSPKVVIRNKRPKVLSDMLSLLQNCAHVGPARQQLIIIQQKDTVPAVLKLKP